MKSFWKLLPLPFLVLLLTLFQPGAAVLADQYDESHEILISEVITGHPDAGASYELVEIYNANNSDIDISGWELEYKSSSGNSWSNRLSEGVIPNNYILESGGFLTVATDTFSNHTNNTEIDTDVELNKSGLRDEGGHLRLVKSNDEQVVADLLGWGDANGPRGEEAAPALNRGQSLYRCFDDDQISNTGVNGEDFRVAEEPKPGQAHTCTKSDPGEESDDGEEQDTQPSDENQLSCQDLIINEVGFTDSGFIELLNTGDDVGYTTGCGLEFIQESPETDTHTVWIDSDVEIEPGELTLITLENTSITLSPSQEIAIYLLRQDSNIETEIDELLYPGTDNPETTLARFGENWEWTYSPTPGEINIEQPYSTTCNGVVISELLPNPEGPRSKRPREDYAFIELHNPTNEPINLIGCGLQTLSINSENYSDIFWIEENITLEADQHFAFYESDSGISLPVGVAGRAFLLSANLDELDNAAYEPEIPEAAVWARFDKEWKWSYSPTPNEPNEEMNLRPCPEGRERNPETNRCRSPVIQNELPDCGPSRERNPDTNRCRQIGSNEPDYVPCGPGRERNPETNRCRQVDSGESDYVPCGPGRERNPETNRCRSVVSTASSLKPCDPGQERNPETNRCRTIASPNEGVIAGVRDVESVRQNPIGWWLAGLALVFAMIYGIWEWRYDLQAFISKWQSGSDLD